MACLRTLVLAITNLDQHWFQQWRVRFDDVQGNVAEFDRRKMENQMLLTKTKCY